MSEEQPGEATVDIPFVATTKFAEVVARWGDVIRKIEDSRPNLFCHPDDELTVRAALAQQPLGVMANLHCSPYVPRGTVLGTPPPAAATPAAGPGSPPMGE